MRTDSAEDRGYSLLLSASFKQPPKTTFRCCRRQRPVAETV